MTKVEEIKASLKYEPEYSGVDYGKACKALDELEDDYQTIIGEIAECRNAELAEKDKEIRELKEHIDLIPQHYITQKVYGNALKSLNEEHHKEIADLREQLERYKKVTCKGCYEDAAELSDLKQQLQGQKTACIARSKESDYWERKCEELQAQANLKPLGVDEVENIIFTESPFSLSKWKRKFLAKAICKHFGTPQEWISVPLESIDFKTGLAEIKIPDEIIKNNSIQSGKVKIDLSDVLLPNAPQKGE